MITIYGAFFKSGKCYIGQTRHWPKRIESHLYEARRGTHGNPPFARALLKYGAAVEWRVIACIPQPQANDEEARQIKAHNAMKPHGYNLRGGGGVIPTTAATRAKIAAAKTGIPRTEKTRAAIAAGLRRRRKADRAAFRAVAGRSAAPNAAAHIRHAVATFLTTENAA